MKNRPGHLKGRNHFDSKDMILLVVMLIIIYGIFTWIAPDPSAYRNNQYQTQSSEAVGSGQAESTQDQ